jgi:hypothetical protein
MILSAGTALSDPSPERPAFSSLSDPAGDVCQFGFRQAEARLSDITQQDGQTFLNPIRGQIREEGSESFEDSTARLILRCPPNQQHNLGLLVTF